MGDKKIKVDDLPEFDIAQHLTDEQAIAANLDVVREEGNDLPPPAIPISWREVQGFAG